MASTFFISLLAGGFLCAAALPAHGQLRAYFEFDGGSLTDGSGDDVSAVLGSSDGLSSGEPQLVTDAERGMVYQFNGATSYIEIELDMSIGIDAMPQVSFGCWAKFQGEGGWRQTIISTDNGDLDRTIGLEGATGVSPQWMAFGRPDVWEFAPAVIDEWVHLVAVYDRFSNIVKLYADGQLVAVRDSFPLWSRDIFQIGRNPDFGEVFSGRIDDVFVYEGILSDQQVADLHSGAATVLGTVTESSERARFEHDGFMPDPEEWDRAEWVLPAAAATVASPEWRVLRGLPPAGWTSESFDDSGWSLELAGFAAAGHQYERDITKSVWDPAEPVLNLRTTFTLDPGQAAWNSLVLWGRWDDEIDISINGVLVANSFGNFDASGVGFPVNYGYRPLPVAQGVTRVGENTVAIQVRNLGGGGYFDLGIVENPTRALPAAGYDISAGTRRFLTEAMAFAQENQIPTLSFAVVRNGSVAASYTIGHLDKYQNEEAPRVTGMRLASVDKPLISGMLERMYEESLIDPMTGQPITPTTLAWPILLDRGFAPAPGDAIDPATASITLGMLQDHTSGLPGRGFPPTPEAVAHFDLPYPTQDTLPELIGSVLGATLNSTPGTEFEYANIGYMTVWSIVNALLGGGFDLSAVEQWYYSRSVSQFGLSPERAFTFGREALGERRTDEAWYQTREWPVNREHSTGMVADAEAIALWLNEYYMPNGKPIPTSGFFWGWQFNGGFSGGNTKAVQFVADTDRTSYVLLTNQSHTETQVLVDTFNGIVADLNADGWEPCLADTNRDGEVTPADFNAWIIAFNDRSAACDQNGDGVCTPADFNGWILNFNTGCN